MIKTILFDMDGVLIESEPFHIQLEIEVFNKHGISLTESIASEYLGFSLNDYITALEKRFEKDLNHQVVIKELHDGIETIYIEEVPLVVGAKECLEALNKTYKLGFVTSRESHLAELVLKRLNISKYFSTSIYKESIKNGKPDPEGYLLAAERLMSSVDTCVVVEDASAGIDAAKRADMRVVARKAAYNLDQDFSKADAIIEQLEELPILLKKF